MNSKETIGQRLAYVDTERILKHIPEYNSAQRQLEALSKEWQHKLDSQYAALEEMKEDYRTEKIFLTEPMCKQREREIKELERNAKQYQQLKFGFHGDLYKERVRLIKPIQISVAKAVNDVAVNDQFDFIFDKHGDITLLYTNPRLDKSKDVVNRLGYKFIEEGQPPMTKQREE